jgi:predicted RNase H-like nuclease (RuvC/YqgF family)
MAAPHRDLVHMFESTVEPYLARENARLRAEATRLRTEAKELRGETARLRDEIRGLRSENRQLRAAHEADRRKASLAAGCSMELTAGTSSGHR